MELLNRQPVPGLVECVPAYAALTIYYDPVQLWKEEAKRLRLGYGLQSSATPSSLIERSPCQIITEDLQKLLGSADIAVSSTPEVIHIPVCYGGEYGEDLDAVAARNGLTSEEVIAIHSSAAYTVYMLGFAPGFPYLGGMPRAIAAPRKASPRPFIPAGSVGIAGEQTGIYPLATPGGWQLIGRTPLALFLPEQSPPARLRAGQVVKFVPISPEEYKQWEEAAWT